MRRQFRTMGATFDWKTRGRHRRPRVLQVEPVAVPAVPQGRTGLPGEVAGRLVPQRRHAGPRAGRGRRPALLALRRAGREARPRAVVPAHDRSTPTSCSTSAGSTGPSRSGSCRRTGSGGPRAPRSSSRSRPTNTAPVATSSASSRPGPTRCSGRRSWSSRPSTRSSRELTHPTTGPRSTRTSSRRAGGPRSSACRPIARRPASRSAATRSTRSTVSGSRSSSPTTSWPVRHRRDHGRPSP